MKTLWKTLILPHMDYCSQLWSGSLNPVSIAALEGPQRAFTKRVQGMWTSNYWERLKKLQLLSIERRFERYKILYTKKSLMGMVPNYGIKMSRDAGRRGCTLEVPPHKGVYMRHRTLREKSLLTEGPRLYNCLPRHLRDHTGTYDSFKAALDNFLQIIPDEPSVGDLLAGGINQLCLPSNSLRDWTRQLKIDNWTPESCLANTK